MFSQREPSAVWRLALPVMLVFAVGSALAMTLMFRLMAGSVRSRGDQWLEAEVQSLAQDCDADQDLDLKQDLRTKLAELIRHETPNHLEDEDRRQSLFFFAEVSSRGMVEEHAIEGDSTVMQQVIQRASSSGDGVFWFKVPGWEYSLRVASSTTSDGHLIIAAATPIVDLEVFEDIRDFALYSWLVVFLGGSLVAWLSTRRVLARVDILAVAASTMDVNHLGRRLPLGIHRDEIERMAAAFNGLLDRIEQGVGHIRAMADAVAHDIRSPLTSIRAGLEAALTAKDSSTQDEEIDRAMAGIDRLNGIISATLDVAEAEAGTLRITKEDFDLSEMAWEMVDLYEALAAERGISLELKTVGKLPCHGDSHLLRRALANLLDNVVSHLPAGSEAQVKLGHGNGGLILEVEDTGPGFPEELIESAFERWVKGPESRGSGLGLAVVRAVALAHGGSVELECASGGGTLVRLILPQ